MATAADSLSTAPQAVSAEALAEEIATQSALLADLRKQQAEGPAAEEVKKKLGELKRTLATLQNAAGGGREKKKERMLLKTPKVRLLRS